MIKSGLTYRYFSGSLLLSALILSAAGGCEMDETESETDERDGASPVVDDELYDARENALTTAVDSVTEAVVGIQTTRLADTGSRFEFDMYEGFYYEPRAQQELTTIGSGFILSEEGYVLTNEHISSHGAENIKITMHDGTIYPAELIDADEQTDIALLKIDADTTFHYVEFANSDSIKTGQWAIAVGNPTGMYKDGKPTVTVGVISASNRSLRRAPRGQRYYLDMIQTDATINAANAGGPLVDANGKVLGINTMVQTGERAQMHPGLGFAVPSSRIKPLVDAFIQGEEVVHDFDPGFETIPVTDEIEERYNLDVDYGLLVMSVNKDGPAYECGILPGDVLLRIDNQRLMGEAHTRAIFNQYRHGDSIDVEVMRNGSPFETSMLLRKKATTREE